MSEKIIDEVMVLFETLKSEWTEYLSVEDDEVIAQGLKVDSATESIRTKLREVLERKPMQEGEIFNWWRGENGFEDHDMCKLQDFSEIVRAVEKRHNIK